MLVFLVGCLLVTIINILLWPFCLLFDRQFTAAHHVTTTVARCVAWLFFTVHLKGLQHLPSTRDVPAAVYVCNHQSTLDVVIASSLNFVNFKVTYKHELLYMPPLGSAMWLSGYLAVKRGDRGSGRAMLEAAAGYLRHGVNVFFFPEGTRKVDGTGGPLGDFKPGAFKLAIEAGVPIVPLTISGARAMMPAKGYPTLAPGDATLTIHPVISSAGKTVEQLSEEVKAAIATGLMPIDDMPAAGTSRSSSSSSSGNGSKKAQ